MFLLSNLTNKHQKYVFTKKKKIVVQIHSVFPIYRAYLYIYFKKLISQKFSPITLLNNSVILIN